MQSKQQCLRAGLQDDIAPQVGGRETREVPHVAGRDNEIGLWKSERKRLRRQNNVPVQRMNVRRRQTGVSDHRPKSCGFEHVPRGDRQVVCLLLEHVKTGDTGMLLCTKQFTPNLVICDFRQVNVNTRR